MDPCDDLSHRASLCVAASKGQPRNCQPIQRTRHEEKLLELLKKVQITPECKIIRDDRHSWSAVTALGRTKGEEWTVENLGHPKETSNFTRKLACISRIQPTSKSRCSCLQNSCRIFAGILQNFVLFFWNLAKTLPTRFWWTLSSRASSVGPTVNYSDPAFQ